MRVLFVTHNIPRWDGDAAGSFVLRLAVALQSTGVRVDIIAPGATGMREHEVLQGIAIHRVRYAADARMTLAYDGTMAEAVRQSWSARWALLRLMRATRRATHHALDAAKQSGDPYTVVHVHWWFPSGLALWNMRTRRETPTMITMHGSDVRLAQHARPARALMRAVLRGAALRTAVSSWLAEIAIAVTDGLRVQVAPMPVDVELFCDDAGPTPPDRSGVLFVGRLNRQKGLAELLQAMARPTLSATILTVVGAGADASNLQRLAHSLGVDTRVRWLGVQAPSLLAGLYRSACVVAMPSVDEGLGLVAVEAQLCATPVVAFASGGLPDVVREREGGVLVTPGDVDGLASALSECIRHPQKAIERGRTARRYMLGRFAPDKVAAVYLALYAESAGAT